MLHSEFMELPFYIMFYLIVFFYGICIGSFLNVVIYRLPENQSLIKRASHCMKCGEKIRAYDNIPVISWLLLKGKCRKCGEPISKRYPIVESLNCIVYLITFTVMDVSFQTIMYCFFFSALICLAFIDWDTMEMDLRLLLFLALLAVPGVVLSVVSGSQQLGEFWTLNNVSLFSHLIGLICISVPFYIVGEIAGAVHYKNTGEKARGIELGDTLMMAAGGLMFGWKAVVVAAFIGIVIAAAAGLINKHRTGESKFAFGPYLAVGLFIGALFGEQLVDLYIMWLTYNPENVQ